MTQRLPEDHDVRVRIVESRGENLLVEAGAGTGKTRLMVERIVSLIEDGTVTLDQVVATTFTERAAAELKGRLREKLIERLREKNAPADRLRDALARVESAAISTIHAFAARLIRERPVEAGVDPGFEVVENAREMTREIWDEWRDLQMERDPERWLHVLSLLPAAGGSDALWPLVSSVIEHRDLVRPGELAAYPAPGSYLDRCVASYREAVRWCAETCADPSDKLRCFFEETLESLEGWQSVGVEDLVTRIESFDFKPGTVGSAKNWGGKEIVKEARQKGKDIAAQLRAYLDDRGAAVLADALDLAGRFFEHLMAEKKRSGRFDFTDLLIVARDLLASSGEARRYFRNRYRAILVDEFQDTDPLQCEIVLLLAREDSGAGPWGEGPLDAGRLFVVGDPKQSIYRFRRADIEIYERFQKRLERDTRSTVETIAVNFRCRKEILDWVNRRFAAMMGDGEDGGVQARYVPLKPHLDHEPEGPAVTLVPLAPDLDEKPTAGDVRYREAHAIAEVIERITGEGGWHVWDKKTESMVPARKKDVAILFPKRTGLDVLDEVLRARGISFVGGGLSDFYEDPEVHALLQTLIAIEDPHHSIAVAATLAGPLFAFSDEQILRYVHVARSLDYTRVDASAAKTVAGLEDAFGLLAGLHEDRNRVPVSATIGRLLDETRLPAFALCGARGERVLQQIALTADRARLVQQQGGLTFGETVLALEAEKDEGVEVAENTEPDEGGDQVQLLTFHKAKGLEFPIVILANLSARAGYRAEPIPLRREGRVALQCKDAEGNAIATDGWAGARAVEERKDLAEKVRQLYVAATRARDHLVVSCFAADYAADKKKPETYLDLIPDLGDLSGAAPRADGVWVFPTGEVEVPEDKGYRPAVPLKEFEEGSDPNLAAAVADFAIRLKDRIESASRSPRAEAPSRHDAEPRSHGGAAVDDGRAAKLGNAFHRLMERADPSDPSLDEALAAAMAEEAGVAGEGPRLVRWAKKAWDTEIGKRMAAAKPEDLYREVPFEYVGADGLLHGGTIDVVLREEGEWVIVDYKTNRVPEDRLDPLVEHYRPQMEAYAAALERVTGRAPAEKHLLFARPGRSVRL